jgi:hypothetical protein
MQKWNLQDIRPATEKKRRSVSPQQVMGKVEKKQNPPPVSRETIPSIVIENGNKKSNRGLFISILLFVVIIGGALGLSALMGVTELTVSPKHRQPIVSAEIVAYPEKRTGELSYEIMTIEEVGEKQVKATGQVDVKELATGVIEIRKSTPGAERLRVHTRFRTPEGLIYRIKDAVVVPGAITDGNGATVPGTIQAEVFADDVGENYNVVAGTSFDIPGFKESGLDDLFRSITAINPQPITGGFVGPQFQIDPGELSVARQSLQTELRDKLLAQIDGKRPSGFISFSGSVAITYNELPSVQYGGELVTIREQAVLQIPVFERIEFGSYLASETIPAYNNELVRIDNPSVLTFAYKSATTSSSVIANEPSLTFKLDGKPLLIWEFDADKLTKDLAGLSKTALQNIISNGQAYPGIDKAFARITPFWRQKFPDDPKDIVVIEKIDAGQAE